LFIQLYFLQLIKQKTLAWETGKCDGDWGFWIKEMNIWLWEARSKQKQLLSQHLAEIISRTSSQSLAIFLYSHYIRTYVHIYLPVFASRGHLTHVWEL